ncbi:HAMP domain-containing histidine kinase [bacterium]|nr:HAMP domain-containing histidine kinase [bacterium]
MNNIFYPFSLRAKLLFIFLLLLLATIGSLTLIYSRSERELLDKVSEDIKDITKAINISVEELTYKGEGTDRLKTYVEALNQKGIQEITILNDTSEVIASSDPKKIGTKEKLKKKVTAKTAKKDIMIMARLGEQDLTEDQRTYNVIMPVHIKGENIGYILISLVLDDYRLFHRKNFFKRVLSTLFAFCIGIIISMIIAKKYTEPIKDIACASRRIAEGDLQQIEAGDRRDEIGVLIKSFNEMVLKLKEQKELEDKLKKSEQLSLIGQLSSGIAHDIRNPLNFLSLSIGHIRERIMEEDIHEKDELLSLLENLRSEINRMKEQIHNFLFLGKPISLDMEWVSPCSLLDEAISMLKGKIADDISITSSFSDNQKCIYCDREFMRICLINLIINAIEAMDGKKDAIAVEFGNEDALSYISVIDKGVGIDEKDREKIFEPYYSTKRHGCGLGLTITKKIISEHGGTITVESSKGKGTKVTIRLPYHDQTGCQNGQNGLIRNID